MGFNARSPNWCVCPGAHLVCLRLPGLMGVCWLLFPLNKPESVREGAPPFAVGAPTYGVCIVERNVDCAQALSYRE